jgi:hypothetical protein
MENGVVLSRKAGEQLDEEQASLFREITGCLMYLSTCTRPDIAYAVGVLTRFMKAPRTVHMDAAKSVMRYVAGTREHGIEYGGGSGCSGLVGYADSDHAGDPDTRRSTTGNVFSFNDGAVLWKSKLQTTVADSTCEAEYMSAAEAVKEALWLRKLMPELGVAVDAVEIKGDNTSALAVLSNPISSARTKHIDRQYHFARERVELGEVKFSYIPTAEMVADVLTKPMVGRKFDFCRAAMGVKSWPK